MSPPAVRIYHNPRCSKSRETLALLQARGIEPEIVEYLKTPLSSVEVEALLDKLKLAPHALLRSKEPAYGALRLHASSSRQDVASAIAREPSLMERPVVVVGERAAIGRPPEKVLALLEAGG